MGFLTIADPLVPGEYATPERLNGLVQNASPNVTNVAAVLNTDLLLFMRGGQVYDATWSVFKTDLGTQGLELPMASGVSFILKPGGATNVIFQQNGGTGAGNIPVQLITGAPNNSLYIAAAGVGIQNSSPAFPLDVTGAARAGALIARGTAPYVCITDTDPPVYYAGIYLVANTLYVGKLTNEAGGAVAGAQPLAVDINAGDNTLVITGTGGAAKVGVGTASPSEKLAVAGNIAASGSITGVNLTASGAFYQGADAGLTGTLVVTGTWNGGASGSRTLSFKGGILTSVT